MKDIVGSMKERQEKALAETEAAHALRCDALAARLREQDEAHEGRRVEVRQRVSRCSGRCAPYVALRA